jgi:hypothetical protein
MENRQTLRDAQGITNRTTHTQRMVSTVAARELTRQTQPPDAENRMSGGVGGLTGAIPLVRPDLELL